MYTFMACKCSKCSKKLLSESAWTSLPKSIIVPIIHPLGDTHRQGSRAVKCLKQVQLGLRRLPNRMIKLICRVLLRCGHGRGGIWDRSTVKRLLLSVTSSVGNDVVSESGWRELAFDGSKPPPSPHPTSQITSQWEKHYTGHC